MPEGFLLDGFPRTIPQAESLDAILKKMGLNLNCVLLVQVPQNIIIERLAGRRTCKKCGALCHVVFNPPKQAGVCDRCGGELYQRDDDREQTITHRLQVYETQTAPLVNYYSQRGLLRTVDGVGEHCSDSRSGDCSLRRPRAVIALKSAREIEIMRRANVIVAEVLQELKKRVAPGVTTLDLDTIAEEDDAQPQGDSGL